MNFFVPGAALIRGGPLEMGSAYSSKYGSFFSLTGTKGDLKTAQPHRKTLKYHNNAARDVDCTCTKPIYVKCCIFTDQSIFRIPVLS